MFADTVEKLAEAGAAKVRLLDANPVGFWIAAMLAGAYVGLGILLIFSIGERLDPAVRPLAMGATFGLALILVVHAGAELYTGHTMVLPLAVSEGRCAVGELARLWATSWAGNLTGSFLLAAIFVTGAGSLVAAGPDGLIYEVAAAKMSYGALPLLARAILCNWLVCLAMWMAARLESEAAQMIAIAWCLLAFIASGYEHSIANMTIFAVALLSDHPPEVTWSGMIWNLSWVTFGNTIAGAVFVAGAYRIVARDAGQRPSPEQSTVPAALSAAAPPTNAALAFSETAGPKSAEGTRAGSEAPGPNDR